MEKSPYVFANDFKYSKEEAELADANARDDLIVYRNDFLTKFKLGAQLKICSYNMRPIILKREAAAAEIETIYDRRLKDEIEHTRRALSRFADDESRREIEGFSAWVRLFYQARFPGNVKLAESRLLGLLASVDTYAPSWESFRLFFCFVNEAYGNPELSCFLLLRSLVLAELEAQKKKDAKLRKRNPGLQAFELSTAACTRILREVFREGEGVSAEAVRRALAGVQRGPLNAVPSYDFLALAVREYRLAKEKKARAEAPGYLNSHLSRQPEPAPQVTQPPALADLLFATMRTVVNDFLQSLSAEAFRARSHSKELRDAYELIQQKMQNLLTAMVTSNKVQWFKELLIEEPSDEQLNYADQLFKDYRQMSTAGARDQQAVVDFCKRIFKTPRASEQVSSLLSFVLGTFDNDNDFEEEEQRNRFVEEEKRLGVVNEADEGREPADKREPSPQDFPRNFGTFDH